MPIDTMKLEHAKIRGYLAKMLNYAYKQFQQGKEKQPLDLNTDQLQKYGRYQFTFDPKTFDPKKPNLPNYYKGYLKGAFPQGEKENEWDYSDRIDHMYQELVAAHPDGVECWINPVKDDINPHPLIENNAILTADSILSAAKFRMARMREAQHNVITNYIPERQNKAEIQLKRKYRSMRHDINKEYQVTLVIINELYEHPNLSSNFLKRNAFVQLFRRFNTSPEQQQYKQVQEAIKDFHRYVIAKLAAFEKMHGETPTKENYKRIYEQFGEDEQQLKVTNLDGIDRQFNRDIFAMDITEVNDNNITKANIHYHDRHYTLTDSQIQSSKALPGNSEIAAYQSVATVTAHAPKNQLGLANYALVEEGVYNSSAENPVNITLMNSRHGSHAFSLYKEKDDHETTYRAYQSMQQQLQALRTQVIQELLQGTVAGEELAHASRVWAYHISKELQLELNEGRTKSVPPALIIQNAAYQARESELLPMIIAATAGLSGVDAEKVQEFNDALSKEILKLFAQSEETLTDAITILFERGEKSAEQQGLSKIFGFSPVNFHIIKNRLLAASQTAEPVLFNRELLQALLLGKNPDSIVSQAKNPAAVSNVKNFHTHLITSKGPGKLSESQAQQFNDSRLAQYATQSEDGGYFYGCFALNFFRKGDDLFSSKVKNTNCVFMAELFFELRKNTPLKFTLSGPKGFLEDYKSARDAVRRASRVYLAALETDYIPLKEKEKQLTSQLEQAQAQLQQLKKLPKAWLQKDRISEIRKQITQLILLLAENNSNISKKQKEVENLRKNYKDAEKILFTRAKLVNESINRKLQSKEVIKGIDALNNKDSTHSFYSWQSYKLAMHLFNETTKYGMSLAKAAEYNGAIQTLIGVAAEQANLFASYGCKSANDRALKPALIFAIIAQDIASGAYRPIGVNPGGEEYFIYIKGVIERAEEIYAWHISHRQTALDHSVIPKTNDSTLIYADPLLKQHAKSVEDSGAAKKDAKAPLSVSKTTHKQLKKGDVKYDHKVEIRGSSVASSDDDGSGMDYKHKPTPKGPEATKAYSELSGHTQFKGLSADHRTKQALASYESWNPITWYKTRKKVSKLQQLGKYSFDPSQNKDVELLEQVRKILSGDAVAMFKRLTSQELSPSEKLAHYTKMEQFYREDFSDVRGMPALLDAILNRKVELRAEHEQQTDGPMQEKSTKIYQELDFLLHALKIYFDSEKYTSKGTNAIRQVLVEYDKNLTLDEMTQLVTEIRNIAVDKLNDYRQSKTSVFNRPDWLREFYENMVNANIAKGNWLHNVVGKDTQLGQRRIERREERKTLEYQEMNKLLSNLKKWFDGHENTSQGMDSMRQVLAGYKKNLSLEQMTDLFTQLRDIALDKRKDQRQNGYSFFKNKRPDWLRQFYDNMAKADTQKPGWSQAILSNKSLTNEMIRASVAGMLLT